MIYNIAGTDAGFLIKLARYCT